MGFKYEQNAGGIATGVFVNKVKIASIKDVSGVTDQWNNTYDLSLEVKLDIGKDFEPTFRVKGNLEFDPISHQPKSFGTARSIGDFFQQLGITLELDEHNRIPAAQLQQAVGKEFYRLQYVSGQKDDGKLRYSDYSQIVGADKSPQALYTIFQKGLAREKPYPNNFHPEIIGNGHQPATSAAPISVTAGWL
jgi:hypothetical protein